MTAIPTLRTARLALEPPGPAGLEAHVAFYASERSRFVAGPLPRELAWRAYAAEIGHWTMRGFGRWSVLEVATGLRCGQVGLWFPDGWPEPEIGWMLYADAEGRGVAYEAALAARDYAYNELGWTTAISFIDPENTRSIALAERLGARPDGVAVHERLGRMHVWRHPSPGALVEEGRV